MSYLVCRGHDLNKLLQSKYLDKLFYTESVKRDIENKAEYDVAKITGFLKAIGGESSG